jgi:hypothetical protein
MPFGRHSAAVLLAACPIGKASSTEAPPVA